MLQECVICRRDDNLTMEETLHELILEVVKEIMACNGCSDVDKIS